MLTSYAIAYCALQHQTLWQNQCRLLGLQVCYSEQYSLVLVLEELQENRAIARKPRNATAVLFGLNSLTIFTTSLRVAKLRKPGCFKAPNTGAKQNLTQNFLFHAVFAVFYVVQLSLLFNVSLQFDKLVQ